MIKFAIKSVALWLLLGPMISFAQVDSIRLPKGDETVKIGKFRPLFKIYVDANNMVYLEKEPIEVHKIAKTLAYRRYKLRHDNEAARAICLYIDERAAYATVDEIKTELASFDFERIYYKTNSIDDKDISKGIYMPNCWSFFKFRYLEKVRTDKQIEKSRRYNDSLRNIGDLDVIPLPPLPMPNWYIANIHKIYSDNQEAVDEALEKPSYTCAVLTNAGFKTDSGLVDPEDAEAMEAFFLPVNIVFVRFDDTLTYANYFKAIQGFKKMDMRKRGFFIELSHEIVDIHKRSEITLCD
ncbi:ExbD/TolR family protein [Winogradskyella sp.]|uniref:ExbD/TolR family protein n=1 Tax=Winogradskyella sp. TaxID=1883156 RepID=UPI003BAB0CEC